MKTAEEKQKIIRIAEACGWHSIQESGRLDGQLVGRHPDKPMSLMIDRKGIEIPDFLNSLDAMHVAEEKLTYDQRPYYILNLKKEMMSEEGVSDFDFAHATARQRAEAFLKTIQ